MTNATNTASLAKDLVDGLATRPRPVMIFVESGPAQGQVATLKFVGDSLTVGRGDEASWLLLDPDISRQHAAIRLTAVGLVIVDLQSKNGTLLADTKLAGETQWPAGARVRIGKSILAWSSSAVSTVGHELAPAEVPRHAAVAPPVAAAAPARQRRGGAARLVLLGIAVLASVGLAWLLLAE